MTPSNKAPEFGIQVEILECLQCGEVSILPYTTLGLGKKERKEYDALLTAIEAYNKKLKG